MKINYKRKKKFFGKFLILASLFLVMGGGALALITSNSQAETLPTTKTIDMEWTKTDAGTIFATEDDYFLTATSSAIIKYNYSGTQIEQITYDKFGSTAQPSVLVKENGENYYIGVGSYSTAIDGLTNKGGKDGIIIKWDKNGSVVWKKSWGGTSDDVFNAVKAGSDGSLIVVGSFDSTSIETIDSGEALINQNRTSGPVTGETDAVIVKYDQNGNVVWQKNYGDGYYSYNFTEVLVDENNYVVIGSTDGRRAGKVNKDAVIVKYDQNGAVLWEDMCGSQAYSTSEALHDNFYGIVKANDGNYVVVGSFSDYLLVDDGINGYADGVIIKYNSQTGDKIWQKTWGGDTDWHSNVFNVADGFVSIDNTSDGGFIVGAYVGSKYIDASGSEIAVESRARNYSDDYVLDGAIIKYDADGNLLWTRHSYGYFYYHNYSMNDERFNMYRPEKIYTINENGEDAYLTKGTVGIVKYSVEKPASKVKFHVSDPTTGEDLPVTMRAIAIGDKISVSDDGFNATKYMDDYKVPMYDGYQFLGWFEKDENGDFKEEAFDFYNTPVESDIDLYARYSDKVTIKFEVLEAGISPLPDVTLEPVITDVGGTATLPTPTSDDYTFVGWFSYGYQSGFGNNTFIFSGRAEEGKTYDKDTTLYGYWKNTKEDYAVNFNIIGETPSGCSPSQQKINSGETAVFGSDYRKSNFRYQDNDTKVSFDNNYYQGKNDGDVCNEMIFNGWYVDEEMTTKFDSLTPITSSLELYGSFYSPYLFVRNDKLLDGNGNEFDETEADGKVHWDSETRTLTLDDYDEEEYLPIKIENGDNTVTIVLNGDNNLNLDSSTPIVGDGEGEINGMISVDGKFVINNGKIRSEGVNTNSFIINGGDIELDGIVVRDYFAMNGGTLKITALGKYPSILVQEGYAVINGGLLDISGLMPMVVNYPGSMEEIVTMATDNKGEFCESDRMIAQINSFLSQNGFEPFSDGADCLARFDMVYPVALKAFYEQEYGPLPEKGGVAFNGGDVTFKALTKEEIVEAKLEEKIQKDIQEIYSHEEMVADLVNECSNLDVVNSFFSTVGIEFSDKEDCEKNIAEKYLVLYRNMVEDNYRQSIIQEIEDTETYPFVIAVNNREGTTSENSIFIKEGLIREPEELSIVVFDLAGEGDYATFGNGGPASFTPVTDPETGETSYVAENILDFAHIYEQKQDITYHWQDDKDEYNADIDNNELKLIIDVDFDHFDHKVEVDGKEITAGTDYEAESGSTEIVLKKDYLNSLATGEHDITVYFANMTGYNDTQVSTAFTIIKESSDDPDTPTPDDDNKDEDGGKSTPDAPDTGDDEDGKKDNEESSGEEQENTNEKSGDYGFNTIDHSAVTATIMLAVTLSSAFFVSRRVMRRK